MLYRSFRFKLVDHGPQLIRLLIQFADSNLRCFVFLFAALRFLTLTRYRFFELFEMFFFAYLFFLQGYQTCTDINQ